MHHLGGEAREDPVRVIRAEAHLPTALFDKVKDKDRRQLLHFVFIQMLAEAEYLAHGASRPRVRGAAFFIAKIRCVAQCVEGRSFPLPKA